MTSIFPSIANDNSPYKRLVEQDEGDVPDADAGGQNLFIDQTDHKLKRKDSSGAVVVTEGVAWEQVVDEPGSSFANFTGASGTWASDGTVIKQTDTSAADRRAKYNTKIVTSLLVCQADVQIRSSGTERRGGILLGFDGTNDHGVGIILREGNDEVNVLLDNLSFALTVSQTINVNTWYTIKALQVGARISFYLDGVLLKSYGGLNGSVVADASFIGLYSYQAEVWFQNIKAWNLGLPT